LIKAGAKLVQQWQDIVSELPSEIAARILPPKIEEKKNGPSTQQELAPADLSEHELKVWSLLASDDATHVDLLLETSGLSFGDMNSGLVGLDIKDLIRVLPGKHYARRL
jgi:predicted Rossmann fold nucleotide-binding protein DprA/Smf involved in DNA uptake